MRITFILPTDSMAGGIRVVAMYANALQAKGHDVTVISLPMGIESVKQKIKKLLTGKAWSSQITKKTYFDSLNLNHHILDKCRAPLDSDVPDGDVLIATWWKTAEWVYALSPSKGVKVYFVQGHEVYADPVRVEKTYWLPMQKIVISRWLEDVMRVLYRDNDCRLIENGVDHQQFSVSPRSKQDVYTVGFIYTPVECKHCSLAINSIIEAKIQIPNLRVMVFGVCKPPESLPEWVDYHSNPPQHEIANIYSACDAWIFTSRSEGFGLPILEAMACRTPVLATRAGAAPEMVSQKNGRLLPDSVEAFVDAIVEFANMDESSWQTVSNNAYMKSLDYSGDNASKQLEKVLVEIVAEKNYREL